jgi:NAD(P)-dependent dehydrogenase (short-subunit alcohol dehydrogenase family)
VVVGVGEGLGSTVARRFASRGDRVGLVARSADFLEETAAELRRETPGEAVAAPADVTEPAAVERAFDRVRSAFGSVDALITTLYSTATASGGVLDVDREAFAGAWRVEAAGVFSCAREAARDMVDGGDGGTIVLTNGLGSVRGAGGSVARSSARFALRGLAESMARDLSPEVHVAQVLVDGWLATPELRDRHPDRPEDAWIDLEHAADAYRYLVEQPPNARSFEVDLRSAQDGLFER